MNFMNNTNPIIIGIDHGYGNIKTAHCCFKTGVAAYIGMSFGEEPMTPKPRRNRLRDSEEQEEAQDG